MLLKEILEAYSLLDTASANGAAAETYLRRIQPQAHVEVVPVTTERGRTDVVRILVPGRSGRSSGGCAPSIGLMGWLGGVGARPDALG